MTTRVLYPMQPIGAAPEESDRLLLYGERDFYGVEPVEAAPADFTGVNEAAAFLRRYEDAQLLEHYALGPHKTLRIARGVIGIEWNGSSYAVNYGYLVDAGGNAIVGTGVCSVTRMYAGGIEVALAAAMPSTNFRVICPMVGGLPLTTHIRAFLKQVLSTTKFQVERWNGAAKADGSMTLVIHASP